MNGKYYILPMAAVITACATPKDKVTAVPDATFQNTTSVSLPDNNRQVGALPHMLIYKMRADYSHNVAVTMNADRTAIVSYPDPRDISHSSVPVDLGDGWYMDRRGISVNTVMTDYTIEEYSKLECVPSLDELKQHIIDLHPITTLWDCGTQRRTPEELQKLIAQGLPDCNPVITEAQQVKF